MKRKTTLDCYNFILIKRPKIASKILNLPTDVMILIFKLLTPSERLNAINVCQQWLDLVNRYFSKDHCVVLSSDLDYSTSGSLYRTFSDRLTTTKHKRTFSQMVIESFPNKIGKLPLMGDFIRLIGEEVKSLNIKEYPYYPEAALAGDLFNVNLNVLSKLPNLESLEVSSHFLLANLDSCTSLKSIKVLSSFCDVENLKNCRKVKSLESLTMSGISISGKELNNEPLVSILEPSTKALIEPYDDITLQAPTFNFCGKAKMTPDDINGIQMKNGAKPLSQKILCGFENLKRLKFFRYFSNDSPFIQFEKPVAYSGITKLTLNRLGSLALPHLEKLFQSFPDLESLKIWSSFLKNEHFLFICQNLHKLKKLVLQSPLMEISVETFFNEQYSLKDLRFLEKLEIYSDSQGNTVQWPSLPNLKELNLQGIGFSNFNVDLYSQIAQKSPKLTHITIGSIDYQSTFAELLPLVQQLKLTHLSLPSVSDDFHTELTTNLIKYCQELKEITITDGAGLSLSQEVELFTNIASLTKITSILTWIQVYDDYLDEPKRVMKRKDAKHLKEYLFKNLSLYKKIRETVKYVAESVIPPNEFEEMNQSYQTNYANDEEDVEDLASFYIVTQNFLQLSNFTLCKLLCKTMDAF